MNLHHARALLVLVAAGAIPRVLASCAEDAEPPTPAVLNDAGPQPDVAISLPAPDAGPPPVPCKEGGWCSVALPPDPVSLNGIWGSSANDVWIVGSPDLTLHWDGATLASGKAHTKQTLFGVWGSGPGDVWTYSSGDAVWHSTGFVDGGPGWALCDAGDAGAAFTTPIAGMWGSGPNDVWTVGSFSLVTSAPSIWHAAGWNGGNPTWTGASTDPYSFNALWGSAADSELWVVGFGGKTRIGKTNNGAATWTPVNSGTSNDLYAVWGSGKGDVWAAGAGGNVRRFTRGAGGEYTASVVDFPSTATIYGLTGFAPDDVWAVGTAGTVAHWDGHAWGLVEIQLPHVGETDLYAVWGSSPTDLWIVGRNVLLYRGSSKLPEKSP